MEGEADPVTEEISATHAGLGSRRDLEKRGEQRRGGSCLPEAGQPQIPRIYSVREGAVQQMRREEAGWALRCRLRAHSFPVGNPKGSGTGPGEGS